MFFTTISVKENVFFQSASWKRHCATHWRERRGWDLVIFDWFVLNMRMQVILDSSFARPGSAPIWGGKKGEFRDWTRETLAFLSLFVLLLEGLKQGFRQIDSSLSLETFSSYMRSVQSHAKSEKKARVSASCFGLELFNSNLTFVFVLNYFLWILDDLSSKCNAYSTWEEATKQLDHVIHFLPYISDPPAIQEWIEN